MDSIIACTKDKKHPIHHFRILTWLGSLLLVLVSGSEAQKITVLTVRDKVSFRGLSVVNDQTVWVSGSSGTVGRSLDGGKTWQWTNVPGFEKRDFRDIEAFDDYTALIMAVAEPAAILKTTDGGKTWRTVFLDSAKGMFLDAFYFSNDREGTVVGDPVNQRIFLADTKDAGEHWSVRPADQTPAPAEGEAFFASSGTNLAAVNGKTGTSLLLASGGKRSNLWTIDKVIRKDSLPILQGLESTGANSIALYKDKGVIVGGDFSKDTVATANCVLFKLSDPVRFSLPKTAPHGYRSCVAFLSDTKLIACGISGVDLSGDGGNTWTLISKEGFHVCQKSKHGNAVFLAGGRGRVAVLE